MYNRIIKLFICLLLITAPHIYSQYVIKGKLIGSDGKPMPKADIVWVSNYDRAPRDIIQKFKVNSDGNFEFDTHRKGMHRIWFCGLSHQAYLILFYLEKPDTTIINVQLQSGFTKDIKRVTVRANYDPKTWKYGLTDTLNLDGNKVIKKTYKRLGPKFEYEIHETGGDNYFAGTQADYYSFDCDSTFKNKYNYCYTNVINTVKDSLFNFEFDPSMLLLNQTKENYTFLKADEKTLKFLKMDTVCERAYKVYSEFAQATYKKNIDQVTASEIINAYSWEKGLKDLDDRIKNEKDPFIKGCWIAARIKMAGADSFGNIETKISKELGQLALNSIEPDSPLWSYYGWSSGLALIKASGETKNTTDSKKNELKIAGIDSPYLNYAISALTKHPNPSIRINLYTNVIRWASRSGRQDLVIYYLDKFKEEFPRKIDNQVLINENDPKRAIKTGNKIPPFAFPSLQDSTKIISNTDMLGKKYLIHVWADWCGPCVTQVEAIRNLNNKFAGNNFAVLSVSICFTKENLVKFLKNHSMPWFNTHVDMRNDKADFLKNFEISTIPKEILVDENGTIIAVNSLEKILEILSKK
jgi:peroxiredoxin